MVDVYGPIAAVKVIEAQKSTYITHQAPPKSLEVRSQGIAWGRGVIGPGEEELLGLGKRSYWAWGRGFIGLTSRGSVSQEMM